MSKTNPVEWADKQLTKNIEIALESLSESEYAAFTVHGRDVLTVPPLTGFPEDTTEEWRLEADEAYGIALEKWRRW